MTLFWPANLDVYPQYPRQKPFRKSTETVPTLNGYFKGIKVIRPYDDQHIRIIGFWRAPDGIVHVKKVNGTHYSGHHKLVRTGCGRNRNGMDHNQLLAKGLPNAPDIPLTDFTTKPMRVTCERCIKQVDEWAMCPEFRARRRELRQAAKDRGRVHRYNRAIAWQCHWASFKAELLRTAPMFLVLVAYANQLEVYEILNRDRVAL